MMGSVLFIRNELQRTFCVQDKVPSAEEFVVIDDLISKSEITVLPAQIINRTNVHVVCKKLLMQESIVSDHEFEFHKRFAKLLAQYDETLRNQEPKLNYQQRHEAMLTNHLKTLYEQGNVIAPTGTPESTQAVMLEMNMGTCQG